MSTCYTCVFAHLYKPRFSLTPSSDIASLLLTYSIRRFLRRFAPLLKS